jgi:2-oxo-4-hydroxy-4-carboxy-5-ureidoimidazoline decarboxylase
VLGDIGMSLVEWINNQDKTALSESLLKCCHSKNWVEKMLGYIPFESEESLRQSANEIWFSLSESDWLEAFSGHPKIGDKKATSKWSQDEQKSTATAEDALLQELDQLNQVYEEKFGFIYIVCATGKSAQEMLDLLKSRISNTREKELENACIEQSKITQLRLEKLV